MNIPHSDALVFFGATGDLVYKKIFPALYAMDQRGHLQVPVIGVARSDWTIEKFRARARASVEQHDGFDEAVFAKFQERLHYISSDYGAPAILRTAVAPTWNEIAAGGHHHPADDAEFLPPKEIEKAPHRKCNQPVCWRRAG